MSEEKENQIVEKPKGGGDMYEETSPAIIPEGAIAVEKEVEPEFAMVQAKERAKVLMKAVEESGLSYDLGGQKKHLGIQAWQILGRFDNATPRVVKTRRMTEGGKFYGYEAQAEVYKNGQIIASADAMCTRDEPNWSDRRGVPVPEFQLRSMAQTRAASKALRMAYGWIAVLAGYADTPAEEMSGNEYDKKKPAATAGGEDKMCEKCGAIMKHIPAGTSKKTGRKYGAFYACDNCKATKKA